MWPSFNIICSWWASYKTPENTKHSGSIVYSKSSQQDSCLLFVWISCYSSSRTCRPCCNSVFAVGIARKMLFSLDFAYVWLHFHIKIPGWRHRQHMLIPQKLWNSELMIAISIFYCLAFSARHLSCQSLDRAWLAWVLGQDACWPHLLHLFVSSSGFLDGSEIYLWCFCSPRRRWFPFYSFSD